MDAEAGETSDAKAEASLPWLMLLMFSHAATETETEAKLPLLVLLLFPRPAT